MFLINICKTLRVVIPNDYPIIEYKARAKKFGSKNRDVATLKNIWTTGPFEFKELKKTI